MTAITLTVSPAPGMAGADDSHYERGCDCPRCSFIDAARDWAIKVTSHDSEANAAYVLADAARVIAANA